MKHIAPALFVVLVACGGGSKKQPDPPKPPEGGDMVSSTTTEAPPPPVEKKPEPPPPPDTGGYHMNKLDAASWQPINPDGPGPEVAWLHGDAQKGGAFLLRNPAGAKGVLHTHTSDYYAIVLSGGPRHYLAGGEGKAKPLTVGSFWFQPGGQPHGDDCPGKEPCVLYIIMPGVFDAQMTPKAKAPAVGKYKMVARKDMKFSPADPSKPDGMKVSFVAGDPKTGPVAFMIEVPGGMEAGMHSHTSDYHAIVLDGAPAHWLPHEKETEGVGPGTYWFQPGGYDHNDKCTSKEPCHALVFMDKAMDFKPGKTATK
jgi:quercetin dioxygenase-like cupin family protein